DSNAGTVDWVRETVLTNDPGNYAKHRKVLASGVVELIRPDPPITHPTLVMTCQNDTGSTPEMSHGIASEIPGAEVIIVPTLQHLGLLERSEAFTSPILGFLGQILQKKE
ncbi:MAG: 3-oxoadipate enol-lactonase, partial [Paracoccaceae bacterium]|nr:3-oxoadipate enol-lactonase [Paracoccaceae bacterium]